VTAPLALGRFDAILLAGGRSARLGRIDKTALRYGDSTLLALAAGAVAGAARIVLVGPQAAADVATDVLVVREHPPFSGPAAALLAGVAALTAAGGAHGDCDTLVVVLACDLVTPEAALGVLAAAIPTMHGADGVMAVDDDGRGQPLLAVYRLTSLRAIARDTDGAAAGLSLRRLLEPLELVEVPIASALLADVDTAEEASHHGIDLPGAVKAAEPGSTAHR
jgi:molybdopterin-guanine dinucleotide biosynthesis protein A